MGQSPVRCSFEERYNEPRRTSVLNGIPISRGREYAFPSAIVFK